MEGRSLVTLESNYHFLMLEKATWYLGIALFVLCLASTSLSTTARPAAEDEEQTEQTEGGQQQSGDQQQAQ